MLDQIRDYKSYDAKFRFKICYPNIRWQWQCHEWEQSSNPMEQYDAKDYKVIQTEYEYFFGTFGGLEKAIAHPEKTLIEEVNDGAFWVGVLNNDGLYMGPPNHGWAIDGMLDWNTVPMKLSVYRLTKSGD